MSDHAYHSEPQHDTSARSTATSIAEGRMKVDIGVARKRRIIKKKLKKFK